MASPLADRRNLAFLLHEVLHVEQLLELPRFTGHSRESFDAVIELAHELAVTHFLPHNRKADGNEPHMTAMVASRSFPRSKWRSTRTRRPGSWRRSPTNRSAACSCR